MNSRNEDLESLAKSSRRTAVLSLLSVLIVFGSLVYSAYRLRAEQRRVEALSIRRDALSQDVLELEARKDSLEGALDSLLKVASSGRGTPGSQNALLSAVQYATRVRTAEENTLSIGFYAFNATPSDFEAVRDSLAKRGYTRIPGENLRARPDWLAARSTVFFYDASMQDTANELADYLSRITKHTFVVERGGGRGVSRAAAARSLRVHWIP